MSVATAPTPTAAASPAPLWLHGRNYDLWWYGAVPVILYVLLTTGSHLIGEKGPVTMYMVSSMLTGLPHNMITWLLILPKESRAYYGAGTIFGPMLLSAAVLVPTIVLFGTPAFAWALSINIAIAYYHITRQHMGLLHSCDGRYMQATGDSAIFALGRELRWLVAAVAAMCSAWKMTGGPMKLGLGIMPMQFTFWPLPQTGAWMLTGVTLMLAFRVGVVLYGLIKDGKRFPAGHALLAGMAMLSLVAAALIPNDQFFLTLALVASYHNLQYFAFCYTHHHLRAVADAGPQDLFTRWARDRKAWPWFVVPVVLGVAYGGLAMLLPPVAMAAMLNFFMLTHYFVDGNIWRRKYYPLMTRFAKGRVEEAPVEVGAA